MATKAETLTKAVVQVATLQLETLQLIQKQARGASPHQVLQEAQYRLDKASEIIESLGGPVKETKDTKKAKPDEGEGDEDKDDEGDGEEE